MCMCTYMSMCMWRVLCLGTYVPKQKEHTRTHQENDTRTQVERACAYELEGWLDMRCRGEEFASTAAAVLADRQVSGSISM